MNEWILEFMWENDQELLYNINNIEYDEDFSIDKYAELKIMED